MEVEAKLNLFEVFVTNHTASRSSVVVGTPGLGEGALHKLRLGARGPAALSSVSSVFEVDSKFFPC